MVPSFDWQEVVRLLPRGYVEVTNGRRVNHGPVESVAIDGAGIVRIMTKWQAWVEVNDIGLPVRGWQVAPNNPVISFPNETQPYVIEETPEKGKRVRFGAGLSILYIEEVEGIDPSLVEGLVL